MLLVAGGELFPNGTGATARMRAFARGFHELGVDVRVLLLVAFRPEAWSDEESVVRGEWRGVPFEYMGGVAHGQNGWLRRRVTELEAIRRTCTEILRSGRDVPIAVVLIATSLRWILPVVAACRVAGVPVVHDRTEFPFVYSPPVGPLGRLRRRAYIASVFRLFDGVVVISTYLEGFVKSHVRQNAWVMRIPILVDSNDFSCVASPIQGLVGYAGNLGHSEELEQLISATSIVRRKHPETRLRIVGGGGQGAVDFLKDVAAHRGIADGVELLGFVITERMPSLLCECAALALPRIAGLFSTAGMPTKLGEYLSTGRPVVVTGTGDIPLFLNDGEDAYVVDPGDVDSFAAALERALYDPSSADLARRGQALASREFDAVTHMRRLLDRLSDSAGW